MKMYIKGKWIGGSDETHIGEKEYEVGEMNAREVGQAMREHVMEIHGTHNEFYLSSIEFTVRFERTGP